MSRKYDNYDSLAYTERIRKNRNKGSVPRKNPIAGICHFQGKLKYVSRKAAHAKLKEITNIDNRNEKRAYKCPHCDAYHLTSQAYSQAEHSEHLKTALDNIFNQTNNEVCYSPERVSKIRKMVAS